MESMKAIGFFNAGSLICLIGVIYKGKNFTGNK
jgi:hypothetical protein